MKAVQESKDNPYVTSKELGERVSQGMRIMEARYDPDVLLILRYDGFPDTE